MSLLKIAGFATAGVFAILIVALFLFFLLLVPRIGLDLRMHNDAMEGILRYGFLRKVIRIPPTKTKRSQRMQEEKQDNTKTAKKKSRQSLFRQIDFGELICEVLGFLDHVKARLRIDKLCIHAVIATGDAAKTGLCVGGLSALVGMIYPFMMRNYEMKQFEIVIDGDFQGEATQYDIQFTVSFRAIFIIWAIIWHGLRVYRIFKQCEMMEEETYE